LADYLTVIVEEVAALVAPLFLLSRSSYVPGVLGKVIEAVPALDAVEPEL
jgi:hypothetical protein